LAHQDTLTLAFETDKSSLSDPSKNAWMTNLNSWSGRSMTSKSPPPTAPSRLPILVLFQTWPPVMNDLQMVGYVPICFPLARIPGGASGICTTQPRSMSISRTERAQFSTRFVTVSTNDHARPARRPYRVEPSGTTRVSCCHVPVRGLAGSTHFSPSGI